MVTDFEEDEKTLKIPSEIFSPLWCEEYLGLKATDFAPGKTYTHSQDDKLNGWW